MLPLQMPPPTDLTLQTCTLMIFKNSLLSWRLLSWRLIHTFFSLIVVEVANYYVVYSPKWFVHFYSTLDSNKFIHLWDQHIFVKVTDKEVLSQLTQLCQQYGIDAVHISREYFYFASRKIEDLGTPLGYRIEFFRGKILCFPILFSVHKYVYQVHPP